MTEWIDIKEREPESEEDFKLSLMEKVIEDCIKRGLEIKDINREVMGNPLIIKINDRIRELYYSRDCIKILLPKEGE